jgi:hypothetical protein
MLRLIAVSWSCLLAGCFFFGTGVPDVPSTARPQLAEDKFLELDAHTESREVSYKVKTGEDCYKGDCVTHREDRTKDVDVRVASATIDGRPLSMRELAVTASPDFVNDTDRVSGLMSSCHRGRIALAIGATAAVVGLTLLQRGFNEEDPQRNLAIGGYASLGVAIVGLAGSYTVFGGQHCKEAGQIYERWETVYSNADKTKVEGDAADAYEVLAKKFNADREARLGAHQAEAQPDPTTEEEAP